MMIWMARLLQLIIWMDRPLANNHPDGLVSCKWSYGSTDFLQMITWRDRPLANDHLEGPASRKWSSGRTGLMQMNIWRDRPLANGHLNGPVSSKWSSGSTRFFSIYLCFLQQNTYFPPTHNIFSFKKFLIQIFQTSISRTFHVDIKANPQQLLQQLQKLRVMLLNMHITKHSKWHTAGIIRVWALHKRHQDLMSNNIKTPWWLRSSHITEADNFLPKPNASRTTSRPTTVQRSKKKISRMVPLMKVIFIKEQQS